MENEFVTVGKFSDIPPVGGREVIVNGRKIAIFKTSTGLYAIDAECPHKGAPLAIGLVDDDKVYCALHGWEFDLRTGICRSERAEVGTYPVRVEGDELRVAVPRSCNH